MTVSFFMSNKTHIKKILSPCFVLKTANYLLSTNTKLQLHYFANTLSMIIEKKMWSQKIYLELYKRHVLQTF